MKNLLPALLLLFSFQAEGKKEPWGRTDEINLIGTPLEQDFELLHREVLMAETLETAEDHEVKALSRDGYDRAVKFLEHSLLKSQHTCEAVKPDPYPSFGFPQITFVDRVVIWFDCADGSYDFLYQNVSLYVRVRDDETQYLVDFYWRTKPRR